ncbi:MAG: LrgB family protein [Gammaproteobacteria bacterium]|nr:LrgB family protein [Gammaproteobacteria bacterium]
MSEFLSNNPFFFILITIGFFVLFQFIQKKTHIAILNPILLSSAVIIGLLLLLDIPYEDYKEGCEPLQYLLTPATICFAIGMYEQISKLKKDILAIALGVISGTAASLLSITLMCKLFDLERALTVSLLPKSITTAIGMALSEEAGGIIAITTAAIVITGCLGNMLAEPLCKLFRFKNPIVQGVAIGTSSHAIGTSKAIEMDEVAGATSSLSLTFAGLVTVLLLSFIV